MARGSGRPHHRGGEAPAVAADRVDYGTGFGPPTQRRAIDPARQRSADRHSRISSRGLASELPLRTAKSDDASRQRFT
jgi:hypothetical protein